MDGIHQPFSVKVNQHPPAQHEGWMVSGEETVPHWVPSSLAKTMVDCSVALLTTNPNFDHQP
jgi:hypothetical protein